MSNQSPYLPSDNIFFNIYYYVCLIGLLVYMVSRFYIGFEYIDKQANIKAQDPKNIKQGCLYFVGYTNTKYTKNEHKYYIHQDELFFSTADGTMGYLGDIAPMTANKKYHQFYDDINKYQQSKCYKVAYIHLDYWVEKETYLYDYFGVE